MKTSTKVIIFGGLVALVGGAYYFMIIKGGQTSVKNESKRNSTQPIGLIKLDSKEFKSRR